MIRIQRASAGDLPALWQMAGNAGVYLPEPENDIWIAKTRTPNAAVVGFIACAFSAGEMSLLGLVVAPTHRHQGIATQLHHTALSELRPQVSFLEVRISNLPAQHLYQKLGYLPVGRRKEYYRTADGGHEDAIVMRWNAPTPP